mgnify:CR=1 FL=1
MISDTFPAIILLGVVLMLEAAPVLGYLRAQLAGEDPAPGPWMIASLLAVVGLCLVTTIVPIRLGLRKIEQMEF